MTISCATQSSSSSCLRRRIEPTRRGRDARLRVRARSARWMAVACACVDLSVGASGDIGAAPWTRLRVEVEAGGHGIWTSATGTAVGAARPRRTAAAPARPAGESAVTSRQISWPPNRQEHGRRRVAQRAVVAGERGEDRSALARQMAVMQQVARHRRRGPQTPRRGDATLGVQRRVLGEDLRHGLGGRDPEAGADERAIVSPVVASCRRARPSRRRRCRAGGVRRGQVGRRVAKGHVRAAADGEHVAAVTQAGEQPVTALRVLLGPCVRRTGSTERLTQTRVGLGAEQLAVEIDADLEARVGGHDLNRGRAAERVADDPDVLEIEVTGQAASSVRLARGG